jgi:N6-L-threonylcarbamoyladenine synthase
MIASGDLEFSFSGLKTAVATLVKGAAPDAQFRADVARAFEDAVVEVLVAKSALAMERTGFTRLVVAGGVGANRRLRAALDAKGKGQGFDLFYPEPELCTDNGAMIALAAALRLGAGRALDAAPGFTVRPRWDLAAAG